MSMRNGFLFFCGGTLRGEGGGPLQHEDIHGSLEQGLDQTQAQDLSVCGRQRQNSLNVTYTV